MKSNKFFKKIVILNTFLSLLITVLLPNILIFLISFTKKNSSYMIELNFTLENLYQAFSVLYCKVYLNSLKIGFITVLLCLILGYIYALCIYSEKNKFIRYSLLIIIIIPFWTSSLIRAYSIVYVLKFNGVLNKFLQYINIINSPLNMLYNEGAVIFGFVYTLIPFMIMPIFLSLRKIDSSLIESAKDLGANNSTIFFKIILPLSSNGIISGCSVVLLSSLGMFYISDLLGGSKNILVGNLIKDQILINNNWNIGGAISILLYIMVIFTIVLQKINYNINSFINK